MTRWQRWTLNLLALVVSASGFAYLWMKYFLQSDDAFAVVNHPWQSSMLHAHVLTSPLLVLVFGVVLSSHILKKLRTAVPQNRRSGMVSLAAFAAMMGSGYLLQATTVQSWLAVLIVVHVGGGVLFTIAYAIHLVLSFGIARRRPRLTPVRDVA